MIMLTTYLLQNILDKWSTSDVRVLFNFDLSTVYAKRASNNRPLFWLLQFRLFICFIIIYSFVLL